MSKPANVVALGQGLFRLDRDDGSHAIAYGVADGLKAWVFLDGQTFVVDASPKRRSGAVHDASALAAPMPATVTQIRVAAGDQVRAGDVLITLEAMKMELPIRATVDGRVRRVNCRVGEMVQPGTPLVELAGSDAERESGTVTTDA